MAINPLDKVYLFIPREDKEKLLEKLQKEEIIQFDPGLKSEIEEETGEKEVFSTELETQISQVEYVIEYLKKYERQKSLMDQLLAASLTTPLEKFEEITDKINIRELYNEIQDLARSLKDLESEETDLYSRLAELEPYLSLAVDFSIIHDYPHIRMKTGSIPQGCLPEFARALDDITPAFLLERFTENYFGADYIYLAFPREFDEQFTQVLNRFSFKEEELKIKDTISASTESIKKRLNEIRTLRERIRETSDMKSTQIDDIRLLYDYLLSVRERKHAESFAYETLKIAVLKGWIRKKERERFEEIVAGITPTYEIQTFEPDRENEEVPVDLNNASVVRPGQFLVSLYSLPKYKEIDPTILIWPFFLLYFGICMGDAGYGLILGTIGLVLLKLYPRSLLPKLLVFAAAATVVTGFFMGGIFGIPYDTLPAAVQRYTVNLTDHMNEFLVFSLSLGAFQLVFGYFIGARVAKMYNDREKLMENLLLGFAFLFLAPLLLSNMFLNRPLPDPWQGYFINFTIGTFALFAIFRIIMSVVKYKPAGSSVSIVFGYLFAIIGGILGGALYSIYDSFMKFFGNMLSYSRLMALGLAGGSVAMAINLMAGIISDMVPVPVLNVVVLVFIMVFGHVINVLLNSLVAFVHSARLQYVEFFPYFFEGGGSDFSPLAFKTRYNTVSTK